MTEETNRDVIWRIGLALSTALHAGGVYYITSHAKAPGATEVPTPAISVSLTPTKVLESLSETGTVESAGSGVLGQGGETEPKPEETPQEEPKPDPELEKREREKAETEAREKAEAEAKALEEERVKAETQAREKAEAEAREKAEAEAKAKVLAEAAAREKAEREAKEWAAAKEKAEAEARAKAEAEERERAEAEAREKAAEAERQKLAEAKRRKEAEEEEARERAEEAQERREEAEKRKKQQSARAPGSASAGNSETPNRSQTGRVSASRGDLIDYKARVYAHIARNLPRGRSGSSGNIGFNIKLTESGDIVGLSIVGSTGNAQLDQDALAALRRAAPFPRAPQGASARERTIIGSFKFRSR
jgi:colicin import membrane protein